MIPLVDLTAQYRSIKDEIDAAIQATIESGRFVLGPNVASLEEEIAGYLGVKHTIGVASGTDALLLSLRAAGVEAGDEVIVPAFGFFATAGVVLLLGAIPVFVDIQPRTYLIDAKQIEKAITPKTRAIIPVHLFGQPADMDEIIAAVSRHDIVILEDNAQSFGALYKGRKTGSIGTTGCLSFFPTKNLGGYGDGGMVTTNNDIIAEKIRMLRTHGWKKKYIPEMVGYNSRLDELQAAILRVKLRHLEEWNSRRRAIAQHYSSVLEGLEIDLPLEAPKRSHVFHLYMTGFNQREEIQRQFKEAGIGCEIYYPYPMHLAEPCRSLGYREGQFPVSEMASRKLLALPLYPELTDLQITQVCETVKKALSSRGRTS